MRASIRFAYLTLMMGSLPMADADAQPTGMTATRVANPADPNAMPLYPGVAPGSEGAKQKEVTSQVFGELWIRNVTRPTLTPFLPKKGKANGAAVLVIPGGGFKFVSMSNEGTPVAEWLAVRGVAAFVLKYRVDETPDNDAEFAKVMQAQFAAGPRSGDVPLERTAAVTLARADAQAALRMIRAHAGHYGIDPKRVGMLGFSAGAMTTMATALADAPDARPDFIAPIYGAMTPVTPPTKPQPMFVAMASDDMLFNKQGFGLIESWAKAGGSTEFHWYSGGGHGFGSHKKGTTSDLWFDQFMAWMGTRGLLKPAK
jgi:acetyl esterase/lipase